MNLADHLNPDSQREIWCKRRNLIHQIEANIYCGNAAKIWDLYMQIPARFFQNNFGIFLSKKIPKSINTLTPNFKTNFLMKREVLFRTVRTMTDIPLIKDFGNSKKLPYRAVFGQIKTARQGRKLPKKTQ